MDASSVPPGPSPQGASRSRASGAPVTCPGIDLGHFWAHGAAQGGHRKGLWVHRLLTHASCAAEWLKGTWRARGAQSPSLGLGQPPRRSSQGLTERRAGNPRWVPGILCSLASWGGRPQVQTVTRCEVTKNFR